MSRPCTGLRAAQFCGLLISHKTAAVNPPQALIKEVTNELAPHLPDCIEVMG